MDFKMERDGIRRRVHREYVDVVVHHGRDGRIDPVAVLWKDGRSFPIDEVLEQGIFGTVARGRQTARWRIRFGNHETELYLEKTCARPEISKDDTYRWWVYAFDAVKHRGQTTP